MSDILWMTTDRARFFLIPQNLASSTGPTIMRSLDNTEAMFDIDQLISFEVTQDFAVAYARDVLHTHLGELKAGLNDKLDANRVRLEKARHQPVSRDTRLTPDALPALFVLLRTLPGVICDALSSDAPRVDRANDAIATHHRRLSSAGIALDGSFLSIPGRLAGLRRDFHAATKGMAAAHKVRSEADSDGGSAT